MNLTCATAFFGSRNSTLVGGLQVYKSVVAQAIGFSYVRAMRFSYCFELSSACNSACPILRHRISKTAASTIFWPSNMGDDNERIAIGRLSRELQWYEFSCWPHSSFLFLLACISTLKNWCVTTIHWFQCYPSSSVECLYLYVVWFKASADQPCDRMGSSNSSIFFYFIF